MKPTLTLQNIFAELIVGILVLLFIYTGLIKLIDAKGFVGAMKHNPLLNPYLHILRWMVPISELIVAVLLFVPGTRTQGLLLSFLLLLAFTAYIAYMLITQSILPCTCGGILEQLSWAQHLWLNSALSTVAFITWIIYKRKSVATNNRSSRTPATIVGNH